MEEVSFLSERSGEWQRVVKYLVVSLPSGSSLSTLSIIDAGSRSIRSIMLCTCSVIVGMSEDENSTRFDTREIYGIAAWMSNNIRLQDFVFSVVPEVLSEVLWLHEHRAE